MDQILLKGDLPELSLSTRVEKEDLMCPSNGLNNSKLKKASAGTSDVLSGKTFYAGDKNLKTGSFNLGAANANPWEVLEGKTFYSNNNKSLQYGTVKNAKNASSIRLDSQNDIPLFYGINSGFHQNTDGGYRFCIWTNMNSGRVYVDGSNTWICVSTDYLEDKSGWQYVIPPGGSVTIPKGYHDRTHSVYAESTQQHVGVETFSATGDYDGTKSFAAKGQVICAGASRFDGAYIQITWSGSTIYAAPTANNGSHGIFQITYAYYK